MQSIKYNQTDGNEVYITCKVKKIVPIRITYFIIQQRRRKFLSPQFTIMYTLEKPQ
jgi:hypothetical protein